MRSVIRMLMCIFFSVLAGCGGNSSEPQPSTVKVVLSSTGQMPVGKSLAGTGVTLVLPEGVTPALDTNGNLDSSVIVPTGVVSDVAVVATAVYTPATSGVPGHLTFVVVSTTAEGYGVGEFVTVNLNVSAGKTVTANDFGLSGFSPIDMTGTNVNALVSSVALR